MGKGLAKDFLASQLSLSYCSSSFVEVRGKEMRAGLGARPGLTVGGGGGRGHPDPPPTVLLPFIQQLLQL